MSVSIRSGRMVRNVINACSAVDAIWTRYPSLRRTVAMSFKLTAASSMIRIVSLAMHLSRYTIAYMHVSEIDTPALVVDLDILERNLCHVAGYAREHGLRLRPHTKTHKSIRVSARQLQSGAVGLTVAKVGEAEVMLGAEPADMLVAYPVIGRSKLERLAEVARRTHVTV